MATTLDSYVNPVRSSDSVKIVDMENIYNVPYLLPTNLNDFCRRENTNRGTLKGFDQTINLILDESHERVYSSTQGIEQVVLGLYIVRGDNVAVVGEVDDELDSRLDLSNIKAEPLNPVLH